MKKSIKTILYLLCLVCLLTLILSSCGISDWWYDLLPNEYILSRVNSESINLYFVGEEYDEYGNEIYGARLDGYIRRFCCNERYIGIQFYDYQFTDKFVDKSKDSSDVNPDKTPAHDEEYHKYVHNPTHAKIVLDSKDAYGPQFDAYVPDFYIVDTEMHKRYGPFDEQTYNEKLEEFGITDMGEWLVTSPAPEGARFH